MTELTVRDTTQTATHSDDTEVLSQLHAEQRERGRLVDRISYTRGYIRGETHAEDMLGTDLEAALVRDAEGGFLYEASYSETLNMDDRGVDVSAAWTDLANNPTTFTRYRIFTDSAGAVRAEVTTDPIAGPRAADARATAFQIRRVLEEVLDRHEPLRAALMERYTVLPEPLAALLPPEMRHIGDLPDGVEAPFTPRIPASRHRGD